jgi:hypothetical protein
MYVCCVEIFCTISHFLGKWYYLIVFLCVIVTSLYQSGTNQTALYCRHPMPNLIAIYWEESPTVLDQKINLFMNIFFGRHLRCMLSVAWSMSVCGSAAARLLGMGVRIPVVSVVCCQVEVSVSGRSLIQTGPTEYGVSNWVWSWSLDNEEALAHQGTMEKIYIGNWTQKFNIANNLAQHWTRFRSSQPVSLWSTLLINVRVSGRVARHFIAVTLHDSYVCFHFLMDV